MAATKNHHQEADSSAAALPDFQQMVALAIAKLRHDLANLSRICSEDPNWNADDFEVDIAVCCVGDQVGRLDGMIFSSAEEFSGEWFKLSAILNLALKGLIERRNWYARHLQLVADFVETLPEMLYFVEKQVGKSKHDLQGR